MGEEAREAGWVTPGRALEARLGTWVFNLRPLGNHPMSLSGVPETIRFAFQKGLSYKGVKPVLEKPFLPLQLSPGFREPDGPADG